MAISPLNCLCTYMVHSHTQLKTARSFMQGMHEHGNHLIHIALCHFSDCNVTVSFRACATSGRNSHSWNEHHSLKIIRCEQGSNLRGKIPLDFKSNALTTRPSQHRQKIVSFICCIIISIGIHWRKGVKCSWVFENVPPFTHYLVWFGYWINQALRCVWT